MSSRSQPSRSDEPLDTEIWLRSSADLSRLVRRPGFWLEEAPVLRLGGIFSATPDYPGAERKLKLWRSVCGCLAGSMAFLVSLGFQIWVLLNGATITFFAILQIPLLALLMAVAVKLAVLLIAKAMLALEVFTLHRRAVLHGPIGEQDIR